MGRRVVGGRAGRWASPAGEIFCPGYGQTQIELSRKPPLVSEDFPTASAVAVLVDLVVVQGSPRAAFTDLVSVMEGKKTVQYPQSKIGVGSVVKISDDTVATDSISEGVENLTTIEELPSVTTTKSCTTNTAVVSNTGYIDTLQSNIDNLSSDEDEDDIDTLSKPQ